MQSRCISTFPIWSTMEPRLTMPTRVTSSPILEPTSKVALLGTELTSCTLMVMNLMTEGIKRNGKEALQTQPSAESGKRERNWRHCRRQRRATHQSETLVRSPTSQRASTAPSTPTRATRETRQRLSLLDHLQTMVTSTSVRRIKTMSTIDSWTMNLATESDTTS